MNDITSSLRIRLKSLVQKALKNIIHHGNLNLLAFTYGTDKRENKFTDYYQRHFHSLRHNKLKILEIGIGGGRKSTAGGASLRMWQAYFHKSMIYGIDIYDKRAHDTHRIKTLQGDQSDVPFLEQIAAQFGPFDIIIDDGSHINEHILVSFQTLFPYVVDSGIYVIEDLVTAYWPLYGGNSSNYNTADTSIGMIKGLIDGLHYKLIPI